MLRIFGGKPDSAAPAATPVCAEFADFAKPYRSVDGEVSEAPSEPGAAEAGNEAGTEASDAVLPHAGVDTELPGNLADNVSEVSATHAIPLNPKP